MFLSSITLFVALFLSLIAAFYSIMGLIAIFSSAVVPIIIMGSILETAKIVVTVWLHEYWKPCKRLMKWYLTTAVLVLMLITSMGIFGFLSKAHLDQAIPAGDVSARVSIIDEKIKTERDNISTARRAMTQMDAAVDQRLSRSDDEKGAERAVQIRRSQQSERVKLLKEIDTAQKVIAKLNEERAPAASAMRKVEAEVGPIKYIAALIYNDKPTEDILEKAVRWVIISIVFVFDPLALMMLLAATESFAWAREKKKNNAILPIIEPAAAEPVAAATTDKDPDATCPKCNTLMEPVPGIGFVCPNKNCLPDNVQLNEIPTQRHTDNLLQNLLQTAVKVTAAQAEILDTYTKINTNAKIPERVWKTENPSGSLKRERKQFELGKIDQLPWNELALQLAPDHEHLGVMTGFGIKWPATPAKGDMFVRVDRLPTALFKFNGRDWIEVDKNRTDQYAYDTAYIDHLIDKLGKGEYEIDLLNDAEQEQINARLNQSNK